MINYSKAILALGLMTMLNASYAVAANDSNTTSMKVVNSDADDLPELDLSFPQYTYRFNTENYQTFVQPVPTGAVEGEQPTITFEKNTTDKYANDVVEVSGSNVKLTGKIGFAIVKYTYPATDSHKETTVSYSVIVTDAQPTLIGTASEWNEALNNQGDYANIKLTNDITLGADDKICLINHKFSGIIDGDGHTITVNITNNYSDVGLIAYSNGAYIKNLRIAGNIKCTYEGVNRVGGFIGRVDGKVYGKNYIETVIENCVSSVNIETAGRSYVGGFIGLACNAFIIKNCLFDGKITSPCAFGRFVGCNLNNYYNTSAGSEDGTNDGTITHCLSVGTINCDEMYVSKGRTNEVVYALDNKKDMLDDGATFPSWVDNTSLTDGSVCWMLNDKNANGAWGQHLEYDDGAYPSPLSKYRVHNWVVKPEVIIKAHSFTTAAFCAINQSFENGVKAYMVTGIGSDNVLTLEEVQPPVLPGIPLIYHNTTDKDLYEDASTCCFNNEPVTDNMLQTSYNDGTYAPKGTYVLQTKKSTGVTAFYRVKEDNQIKIKDFHCYLKVPSAEAAPQFNLPLDNGTTGIDSVESDGSFEGDGKIYDLSGRRVSEMQKGQVYIIGGHKVMVK